jgi:hypothetical protein
MSKMNRKNGDKPTLKNCVLTENGKKRVLEPAECREMQKKMFGKSSITDEQIAYAKKTKASAKKASSLRKEQLKNK